jgi:DNA-directed RNA polymerase specialized sigma24 family protein
MANTAHNIPDEIVAIIRSRSKSFAPRLGITLGDRDDIEQELLIHAWQQAAHHNPLRGSICVFLGRVVDHRIGHLVEAARAQKRGGGVRPLSLEMPVTNAQGHPVALIDLLSERDHPWGADTLPADERADIRHDLLRALRGLPDRLVVLCRWLAMATVAEVARDSGVSRSSLYSALGEVRTAFRAAGLDAYLRPPRTHFPRFR